MSRSGSASHGQQEIARQIHADAQDRTLRRETLRVGILLFVCPKLEARLTSSASRTAAL